MFGTRRPGSTCTRSKPEITRLSSRGRQPGTALPTAKTALAEGSASLVSKRTANELRLMAEPHPSSSACADSEAHHEMLQCSGMRRSSSGG
jgi:hypothetical protein